MVEGSGTSIWVILLTLLLVGVFYVHILGPVTFISSDIAQREGGVGSNIGIYGFFVAWMPYLILLGFILLGILWPIFSG
jgi:hypothetical protein